MTNDPHSIIDQNAREQLSALLDDELDGDAARFLRRRLEHDDAMVGQLVRWQLAGDVLRAHADRPAQDDLASRVRAVLERESAPVVAAAVADAGSRRRGVSRWAWRGGLAAAAALAFVAMMPLLRSPTAPATQTAPMTAAVSPAAPAAVANPAVAAVNNDEVASAQHAAVPPSVTEHAPQVQLAKVSTNAAATHAVAAHSVAAPAVDVDAAGERPFARPATQALASAQRANAGATLAQRDRASRDAIAPRDITASSNATGNSDADRALPAVNESARVASAAKKAPRSNPFTIPADAETLPWPKAAIPSLDAGFNASFSTGRSGNPFQPRRSAAQAEPASPPQP